VFDRRVLKSSKIVPKWSQPYRVRKWIWNAYLLEQLDGTPVEGEFSARRLHAFVPRRGGQLEKDQTKWEEEHKDDQDEEELEEELEEESEEEPEGDAVWTPLFAEGEHGMGSRNQGAQENEAPDTSMIQSTITR
jgi:hypothetical protein